MESMKSDEVKNKEKIMKLNIINNFSKIHKTDRDPYSLAEDISVKISVLLTKHSLNKYKPEMFTTKLFSTICNSNDFQEIKDKVAELQVIILLILESKHK